MDKVWLFTEEEFLILASACGIKSLFGFPIDMEKFSREDAIYSVQELRQRGLLEVGETMYPTEEMQEIFGNIRDAQSYVEVRKKSGRTCVIYIDKIAVKVSKSMRREGTFEVITTEVSKVWDHLTDEGWV
ncbi:MAG: hypothetical protein IKS85_06490 [Lachnospiraceae bacterium]|nr:hypothetical protein [Lachnospiraceae bacterium]